MLFTRIRPALFVAACALLCGPARSQDKAPPAPPPRPVKGAEPPRTTEPKLAEPPKKPEAKPVEPPAPAVTDLEQAAREWAAHKGAVELAYHRFAAQAAELTAARQRLADHKVPGPAGGADVKAAQEAADGHAERVKRLEAARDALAAVGQSGDAVTAAAAAADRFVKQVQASAAFKKDPAALGADLKTGGERIAKLAAEATPAAAAAKGELATREKEIAEAKAASAKAVADLDELKRTRDARAAAAAYEERLKGLAAAALADEFTRLRKQTAEKANALAGDEADYQKAAAPVAEARARIDAIRDPLPPTDAVAGSSLDAAAKRLAAAQQYLAGRARTFDERAEKSAALVAALDEQEKKARAYSSTLDGLREASRQLATAAAEIGQRVGRGEFEVAKVPDGLAEAAGPTNTRAKLDADADALQAALVQLRAERDRLRKPDTEVEGAKALTAALLASVNERIDLHADLRRLAADYATTRATRSDAEQKRLDQKAAARAAKDAPPWDMALALDRSRPSTDLGALLAAYYSELVELEEKDDNLKRQKEALEKLVRLTEKEAGDVAKLRTLAEKRNPPDGPLDEWLALRLTAGGVTPTGLKDEADIYRAESARLTALGGSNARRSQALAADVGATRDSLLEARARGLVTLAVKVGLVLLAALILPRLITAVLRRSVRAGSDDAGTPAPVLRPIRGALRVVIWLAALAVVLSILGLDVTAFVIAVAVGVLAFALAARPLIADMLGSVAVSAERRFKVGDVIRLGGAEPARVVGVTWRSVSLKNTNGVVSSVPNRAVAEATVENLTRGTETYDTLTVTISTDKDAGKVINVIRAAMTQCKNLTADQGVTVVSYIQKGAVKLVQYRFWWFLKDYEQRNKTRDEVFARVSVGLAHEDLAGIEIAMA